CGLGQICCTTSQGGSGFGDGEGITNPAIGALGNNPDAAISGATTTGYFVSLWRAAITIGGLMVLIFFIWGAIEWITSGGDSGKVASARNRITQAVIGMIILAGSFVLIGIIGQIFFPELNLLNPTLPSPA